MAAVLCRACLLLTVWGWLACLRVCICLCPSLWWLRGSQPTHSAGIKEAYQCDMPLQPVVDWCSSCCVCRCLNVSAGAVQLSHGVVF
ncbi:hypothetical protein COO60DRAFT_802541 [Scenedesmus sp. NREL 46B-D3]|nr:hypothetical protein COO60DRAFT_802541 [Scenedesmus sp. NREL 46B-D3]